MYPFDAAAFWLQAEKQKAKSKEKENEKVWGLIPVMGRCSSNILVGRNSIVCIFKKWLDVPL